MPTWKAEPVHHLGKMQAQNSSAFCLSSIYKATWWTLNSKVTFVPWPDRTTTSSTKIPPLHVQLTYNASLGCLEALKPVVRQCEFHRLPLHVDALTPPPHHSEFCVTENKRFCLIHRALNRITSWMKRSLRSWSSNGLYTGAPLWLHKTSRWLRV